MTPDRLKLSASKCLQLETESSVHTTEAIYSYPLFSCFDYADNFQPFFSFCRTLERNPLVTLPTRLFSPLESLEYL